MPIRDLGSHLETPPPPSSQFWRANIGNPNEWLSLSLGVTVTLENLYNGEEASSLSGRTFLR